MKASTDDVMRYGSIPMSIRRVAPLAASFVCMVEKTRCPVSAVCMVISAVSKSLTSPTIITSGSCLSMLLRAWANVRPIRALTWVCEIPFISYSTGSSMVSIFLSRVLMAVKQAYRVVVLPLPVGPVTNIMPCGFSIIRRRVSMFFLAIPRWDRLKSIDDGKILITMFSP